MFLCQLFCSLLVGFQFHEYGIFPSFLLYSYYLYFFLFMMPFFHAKMNVWMLKSVHWFFYMFYLLHIICIISFLKISPNIFVISMHTFPISTLPSS